MKKVGVIVPKDNKCITSIKNINEKDNINITLKNDIINVVVSEVVK